MRSPRGRLLVPVTDGAHLVVHSAYISPSRATDVCQYRNQSIRPIFHLQSIPEVSLQTMRNRQFNMLQLKYCANIAVMSLHKNNLFHCLC